ncbi:MAG: ComF family protein [Gammaproteobacteria bacterium]|nr:ComF family protein [Gammaproteobacteria bacterium]
MIKIKKYLSAAWPSPCILCGGRGDDNLGVCAPCLTDLPWLGHTCFTCARPVLFAVARCGTCLSVPPPYFRTVALFAYQDVIARCLTLLKFHKHLVMGRVFGRVLAKVIQQQYEHDTLPQCIIPMPLHETRLKERGFNQALELALPVAKQSGIGLDKTSCRRIKQTLPQTQTTTVEERINNVKGAFEVSALGVAQVAIVDDVVTTTATVSALAQALLKSGVGRVDVWCCARTA